jgi:hypothetical protein
MNFMRGATAVDNRFEDDFSSTILAAPPFTLSLTI